MNAVGIDVSKGKSMIAVMRPFGEVMAVPYEVSHTTSELKQLAIYLKSLDGETRVVMEYTGKYYQAIARYFHNEGIFVSVVHAKLIHDYGNNSIRKVKTDKADAVKIANYGLTNWAFLKEYVPEKDTRLLLKTYNRQYSQYMKLKTALKNNLISLLDQTFPGINSMFSSPARKDGHEKWMDFVAQFWHCACVNELSLAKFTEKYNKWCKRNGYNASSDKAQKIHEMVAEQIGILPKNDFTKELIKQAVEQVNAIGQTLATVKREMQQLASTLPEYEIVMSMYGVGETLGPQLIAEIGDVRRFSRKQSLVAFAGVDAPPFQSGTFESRNRSISKRGSPNLRKTLFQVMTAILQNAPPDEKVFQFLDKKRSEGKHYYVYMIAGCNKFLQIYYGKVNEHWGSLDAVA